MEYPPKQDEHISSELTDATRDELRNQLSHAISLQCSTNQILWTVFGIFWAANAALLVALFATGTWPERSTVLVVSSIGAALSTVWFYIQRRAVRYLSFYEALANELERALPSLPPTLRISKESRSALFEQHVGRGVSVRPVILLSAGGVALCWVCLLVAFFVGRSPEVLSATPASSLTDDQACELWVGSKLRDVTDMWSRRYSFLVSCATGTSAAGGAITVTATLANGEPVPDQRQRDEAQELLRKSLDAIVMRQGWQDKYSEQILQFLP